eukprot:CAMPEP_0119220050 /NCGR_PEP_ID=MMETSP1327-20130426/24864_1 /TAXON_ID=38833 /ORGANISM="Micromonas pusilla, Strain RCC2306" /LENGTH=187 /DNA_ID=CAMNT_0007218145 /DNA_START=110 /DNA_END=670 /DNA_ORIENTATION=-
MATAPPWDAKAYVIAAARDCATRDALGFRSAAKSRTLGSFGTTASSFFVKGTPPSVFATATGSESPTGTLLPELVSPVSVIAAVSFPFLSSHDTSAVFSKQYTTCSETPDVASAVACLPSAKSVSVSGSGRPETPAATETMARGLGGRRKGRHEKRSAKYPLLPADEKIAPPSLALWAVPGWKLRAL